MKTPTISSRQLSHRSKTRRADTSPLQSFSVASCFGAVGLIIVSSAFFPALNGQPQLLVFGLIFYLFTILLSGFFLRRFYPHTRLGLCNLATLARLVIVAILFTAVISGTTPGWLTFGISATALALDGVDGWLARRQGLASNFGAQFDVEVDAVFALTLAIYAATNGTAGIWVILLGLPHYLFWIARLRFPWLNGDLRPSLARKAICVFQIGTLIALQIPVFAPGQLGMVIIAVACALVWSFGRDVYDLSRKRT